jgi:regulator of protease activity HflC (stomatin/prohibitin superfamily)
MGDLIRALVEIVLYLFPVRMIWSYENGLRFWGGREPELLGPGFYFFVPFFSKIVDISMLADTIDLPFQSITTSDDVAVDLSANFIYRVVDAKAYFTGVQDFETNFPRLAARHVMSKARGWSYAELMEKQADYERSLQGTLTTRIARHGWGVEIVDAGFTDMVKTRQYRLH